MSEIVEPYEPLPVADVLPELLEKLARTSAVVLRAPPGAGKTTLVPLALMNSKTLPGKIIITQPRRLAARATATRLCKMSDVKLGQEIGYQVRGDRRWQRATQVVAMTTGVLLRRLLSDPFLDDFGVVILDEFHERSLEMDLTLGMLRRLQQTVRPELRVLVMSATLDCGPIVSYLDGAPVVESQGRMFPVSIRYARHHSTEHLERQIVEVLPSALSATPGHVLIFLPGVGEIKRTAAAIEGLATKANCQIFELFGDLSPNDQDRVLAPGKSRKIILATNVAETSLTIDGVTGVIDSGRVRTMRYDLAVGLSRLQLESNSLASADQRAGRAGRQAPGVCFRLWTEAMNRGRADFDTPEILRGDLSGAVLQLASLGEQDAAEFPWLTVPSETAIETAKRVLRGLGALDGNQISVAGHELLRVPTTPRLAKLLLAARDLGVGQRGAFAAALLSERDPFRATGRGGSSKSQPRDHRRMASDSDLVDRVSRLEAFFQGQTDPDIQPSAAQQVLRTAKLLWESVEESKSSDVDEIENTANSQLTAASASAQTQTQGTDADVLLQQAIAAAYWDRLARRRQIGSDRGVMVGGLGVKLARTSAVTDAEYFVCLDVDQRPGDNEVRMASAVAAEWMPLELMSELVEYFFHPSQKNVQARRREYFMDLVIDETPVPATDHQAIAEVLYPQVVANWGTVLPSDEAEVGGLLTRLACVREWFPEEDWPDWNLERLHEVAKLICLGCRSLADVKSAAWGDYIRVSLNESQRRQLETLAPQRWTAPSGNQVAVAYEVGRPPKISVRLQELFGLPDTPRLGGGRIPCLLELLGPNYRPQQLTSDLASFWKNTYPTVRKELQRRYPKHHWPDDPLQATASRSGLKRDA